MALIPSSRYPAQIETGLAGYPQGKARNAGSFQDGTGTPLEQDWLNDVFGLQQALLDAAGIVPSGSPDEVGESQYLDAIQSLIDTTTAPATRRALLLDALFLRPLVGGAITDVTGSMAAATILNGTAVLAIKADPSMWVGQWGTYDVVTAPGTIDTARDAAVNPTTGRVVVVGKQGGNSFAVATDDSGLSWTPSAGFSEDAHRVVWTSNAANSGFVISCNGVGSQEFKRTDGIVTLSALATGFAANEAGGGIAVLNAGNADTLAALGHDAGTLTTDTIRFSTDGGDTWAVAFDFAPGAFITIGCICGNGSDAAYHAGVETGGASLRISESSADGADWTTAAALAPPLGTTFAGQVRIMRCQSTGLLVAIAFVNASIGYAAYASLDGVDWVGPVTLGIAATLDQFALAGGRLFATRGAMILASDGIGVS